MASRRHRGRSQQPRSAPSTRRSRRAMIDGLPPSQQALYGTLFTWFVTALGSGVVFVEPLLPGSQAAHQLFLDTMLGFAGGVMIAASYWSLLAPGALPISRRALVCAPPIDRCVCVSSGHACLSVPAIAMAEQDWYGKTKFAQIDLSNGISKEVTYAWLPAAVGFAAGGVFLVIGDYVRMKLRLHQTRGHTVDTERRRIRV